MMLMFAATNIYGAGILSELFFEREEEWILQHFSDNFRGFGQLVLDKSFISPNRLDLVTHELLDLINTGDPFLRLTKKYYAEKSLWYLRHLHLTPEVYIIEMAVVFTQDIKANLNSHF